LPSLSSLDQHLTRVRSLFSLYAERLKRRGKPVDLSFLGQSVIHDEEVPALVRELEELGPPVPRQDRALARALGPFDPRLPAWERSVEVFGLSPIERDLLALVMCVELDPRYTRLVAYLNDNAQLRRPTVGLAVELLSLAWENVSIHSLVLSRSSLGYWGLLHIDSDSHPLPLRALRVPESVWLRLGGLAPDRAAGQFVACQPGLLDELVLSDRTRQAANRIVELGETARIGRATVAVTGPEGSGKDALAAAIASRWGFHQLVVDAKTLVEDPSSLRREAGWHHAAIVVRGGLEQPAPELRTALEAMSTPVIWVAPSLQVLNQLNGADVVELTASALQQPERRRLWEQLLPRDERGDDVDLDLISDRFLLGPREMHESLAWARSHTRSTPTHVTTIGQAELQRFATQLRGDRFGVLAEQLECTYEWDDLVVTEHVQRELQLALRWAKHGTQVLDGWGLGRRVPNGRSLACLFSGSPGTGKTMAAQILAKQLGATLYRIDLSQVVNKYIGETEKNLGRIFDAACGENVLLFFDEADALFGKRTEVRDAHDRYANVETGYLLQRVEQHHGAVVLATNLRKNIDDAFLRRLHVVIDFPMPGPAERLRLWNGFLLETLPRGPDVDLAFLAQKFAVAGGDIRNAVMCAAVLAAGDGTSIGMRHLVYGLWRELQKGSRLIEPAEFGPWSHFAPEPPNRSARSRADRSKGHA
jgi:AAA+ superfamily predicted ATPase